MVHDDNERVCLRPPTLPFLGSDLRPDAVPSPSVPPPPVTAREQLQQLESEFSAVLRDCAKLRSEINPAHAANCSKHQAERSRLEGLAHVATEHVGAAGASGGLPGRNLVAYAKKVCSVTDALLGANHARVREDYLARPRLEAAVSGLAQMPSEGVARLEALNLLAELVARDGDKPKAGGQVAGA